MNEIMNIDKKYIDRIIISFCIYLLALILPILLIFTINFTGYSVLYEELCKTIVIFYLILRFNETNVQYINTFIFGLLFGLSESFLYLINILQIGNYDFFLTRLYITIPMHIITSLVVLYFARLSKKMIIVGFLLSLILHYTFNYLV